MLQQMKLKTRLLGAFITIALITAVTGAFGAYYADYIGSEGELVGSRLAPLGDASMEIKLTATKAHLVFEEILAGDSSEDIDEVWKLLDQAKWFADAILFGGKNEEGLFYASEDQRVLEQIRQVKESLALFVDAASQRYDQHRGGGSTSASSDQQFDEQYDRFIALADEAEELVHESMATGLMHLKEGVSQARMWMLIITLLAIVAAIGLGFMISSSIIRPVDYAVRSANKIATGDLSVAIERMGSDELGVLLSELEEMRKELLANRQTLVKQAEEDRRRLDKQTESQLKEAELVRSFESSIGEMVQVISRSSGEMMESVKEMSSSADHLSQQAGEAAEGASVNGEYVTATAAATEQMSASISMALSSVQEAMAIADEANLAAKNTDQTMRELNDASENIGDVINVITDIAEQTNLLALNASIEAARAGDAGRGFAVVAGEVKELATQTTQATNRISQQIATMQQQTRQSITALQQIGKIIERINDSTRGVSGAMDEQASAIHEIASGAAQAESNMEHFSVTISNVSAASVQSQRLSGELDEVSTQLSDLASQQRQLVEGFLSGLKEIHRS